MSLMKQSIKLTITGVAHEVSTNPRDYARVQRELPKVVGLPLEEAGELELMMYLAYAVSVRKAIYTGTYDAFCDDLDLIELVEAVPLVEEVSPAE